MGPLEHDDLMTRVDLSNQDHVLRHVNKKEIRDDGVVDGSVFQLRTGEVGLSANWMEYCPVGDKGRRIDCVAVCIQRNLKKTDIFVEMIVGDVIHCLRELSLTGRVWHDPMDANDIHGPDPSHCQITGIPPADAEHSGFVGQKMVRIIQNRYQSPYHKQNGRIR